jgi:hypothetical protein
MGKIHKVKKQWNASVVKRLYLRGNKKRFMGRSFAKDSGSYSRHFKG